MYNVMQESLSPWLTIPQTLELSQQSTHSGRQRNLSGGSTGSDRNSPGPRELPRQSQRYKTELCRQFVECGQCRYGEKCQFAHGFSELRAVTRHPKYKTDLCRNFNTTGFCPYGPRCHFIHNVEERRDSNVPSSPIEPQPKSAASSYCKSPVAYSAAPHSSPSLANTRDFEQTISRLKCMSLNNGNTEMGNRDEMSNLIASLIATL